MVLKKILKIILKLQYQLLKFVTRCDLKIFMKLQLVTIVLKEFIKSQFLNMILKIFIKFLKLK